MRRLLTPDVSTLAPPVDAPQHDRAPDALAHGTPERLREDLCALVGADRVLTRAIDLLRYATDASPYRLFPKAVVVAGSVEDVRKVLAYARERDETVTFRAAGTSLSGQAQGDGILVDVRRHWTGVTVEEGGRRLRARPGTILYRANLALAPHGYRLGPDPASASACTIGGVIANNSSGMCCGTTQNSYKTVSSLTFLLPSGTLIDTADGGGGGAAGRRRTGARRRTHGDQARDRGRRRAGRAGAAKIPHQEHHRLPHGGVSRRRHAGRDLPAAHGRIGRHARVHRRSGVRHHSRRPAPADRVHDLSRHPRPARP